jgi:tetratricopeptide (TPR) repeat protein
VPHESPRIAELRRRVHADPASIAFAQLAEEYRRAGQYDEAVKYCRAGLTRHPGYLSARVTLGRSLMELGELDAAASEFDFVLRSAPDNLAAIRGSAEIHQRRGSMEEALEYYSRALTLAPFDPELGDGVKRITQELGLPSSPASGGLSFEEASAELLSAASRMSEAGAPQPEAPSAELPGPSAPASEPVIDFDALLASLGAPDASPPPVTERLISAPAGARALADAVWLEPPVETSAGDPFAVLEQELRLFDERPAAVAAGAEPAPVRLDASSDHNDNRVIAELEAWLHALEDDSAPPTA